MVAGSLEALSASRWLCAGRRPAGPYAEGFSVSDIIFDVTVDETVEIYSDEVGSVYGYGEGIIKGTSVIDAEGYSVLDLNKPLNLVVNTSSNPSLTIKEISLNNIYVDTENLEHLTTDRYTNPNYNSSSPFYFYQNQTQNRLWIIINQQVLENY